MSNFLWMKPSRSPLAGLPFPASWAGGVTGSSLMMPCGAGATAGMGQPRFGPVDESMFHLSGLDLRSGACFGADGSGRLGTNAAIVNFAASNKMPSRPNKYNGDSESKSLGQALRRNLNSLHPPVTTHAVPKNLGASKAERGRTPEPCGQSQLQRGEPETLEGTLVFVTCHSLKTLRTAIGPLVDVSARESSVNEIFENAKRKGAKKCVTWAVMFKTRRQARSVVRYLGGQGHDVRLADEPELSYTNVYIANLPEDVTQQDIEKLMSNYGTLVSIKLLQDSNGRGTGVAFANMSTPLEANNAIRGIHNKKVDGWGSVPYARLAYRYGKSAHIARLLRLVATQASPQARAAAASGKISLSAFTDSKERYGIFWNSTDLALMSLCQIYRQEQRRNVVSSSSDGDEGVNTHAESSASSESVSGRFWPNTSDAQVQTTGLDEHSSSRSLEGSELVANAIVRAYLADFGSSNDVSQRSFVDSGISSMDEASIASRLGSRA